MTWRHASLIAALALAAAACGDGGDRAAGDPGTAAADEPGTTAPSPPSGSDANTTLPPDEPPTDSSSSTSLTTLPIETGTTKPTLTTGPTGPTVPISIPADPTLSRLVDTAMADLAARLGIDAAEIDLVGIDQVTWGDGSIGCPQPGMSYTQALVDGTRIRLVANGVVFEYHSGGSGDPFYCPDPIEPAGAGSGGLGDT